MCGERGEPLSTEVLRGNPQDPATLASQVKQARERFGGEHLPFVGGCGRIPSGPLGDLAQAGFPYLTALTQPPMQMLRKTGVLPGTGLTPS